MPIDERMKILWINISMASVCIGEFILTILRCSNPPEGPYGLWSAPTVTKKKGFKCHCFAPKLQEVAKLVDQNLIQAGMDDRE